MRLLLTGGAGSLGQAVIELMAAECDSIAVLSRDEYKHALCAAKFSKWRDKLRFFLGDVRDRDRLRMAFQGVDAVAHLAALKRVDSVANDPREPILTNVLGSMNVVDIAAEVGVPRVLLVSTDKASSPQTSYGVTKAAMEFYGVNANSQTLPRGTRVSVSRWGNVINSRGGVLELWRKALADGQPFPVTDPRMTRFWLTLDQAAVLVRDVLTMMQGGEIWVPALPAAPLSALREALSPGHEVEHIGIRGDGEKLHETLMSEEESSRAYRVSRRWSVILPNVHSWAARMVWAEMERATVGEYRSDTARPQLTTEAIAHMLKALA